MKGEGQQDTLRIGPNDALWAIIAAMEYPRIYYEIRAVTSRFRTHWHREDTMKELFYLFHEQLVRIKRYFPRSHGVQRVEDRRIVIGLSMSSSTACNGKMPHVSMGHTKLPTIALSSGAD